MKIICNNFFALTLLFVIQSTKSECDIDIHNKVANCSSSNLHKVPMLNNTKYIEVLQLDNNSLTVLDDTSLRHYVRLRNLSIRGNELNKIEIQDNSPIKNILYLDLSSNNLERLPDRLLQGCSQLQSLSLSHNKLLTLGIFQFSDLTSLRTLDLSHNRLSLVQDRTFYRLGTELKTLLLNNNNFKTLGETPFLHLRNIKMAGRMPHCEAPERVAGSDWRDVSSQEFACPPRTQLNAKHIQTISGRELGIQCLIQAIRWLHNETLMKEEGEGITLVVSAVSKDEIRSELVLNNVTKTMAGRYTCVAINNAGVSAASTDISVVHLSFIYRFSWEFWFLVLLSFILIFFIFVGIICKAICRKRPVVDHKEDEETKTEVEFQYAETFLRESDNFPVAPSGSESSGTIEKKRSLEEDCPQFQAFPSTFSQPSPMLFNLQQRLESPNSSLSEKKLKTPSDLERAHRHHKKSSKVLPKKVPPPTLPKPKFHPSFLTHDINVNYVMTFPTYDQKF